MNKLVNHPDHYNKHPSPRRIPHIFSDSLELKWCGKCKRYLPLNCFAKNKVKWDGLQERCTECRCKHYDIQGRYTKTIPPKEVLKERHRRGVIKSYGIDVDYFNNMLKNQQGKCAICGSEKWGKESPCIDHNHKTGKVRALLCNNCNRVLGMVKEDVNILLNMIEYIRRYNNE